MKKPKQITKWKLSKDDLEKLELLQKVHEQKGMQLRVNVETGDLNEFNEIRELIGKQFENPEEKYSLYYKGIRNILMTYLPKGKKFLRGRQLIYDEKNIFLNMGKTKSENRGIRKSDGRMTFQEKMGEMLDVILQWVSESQNPVDIFNRLYDLNEKHGYPHEIYDKTSVQFQKNRK